MARFTGLAAFCGHGATGARRSTGRISQLRGQWEGHQGAVGKVEASKDSNQEVATKVSDSKTKARSRVLIKHLDSNLKQRIYLVKTEPCLAPCN